MMKEAPESTLVEFVRYNQWANQKLLSICMNLDEAMLKIKIPGAFGTVFETFHHLLRAEASFLKRIHGDYPHPSFRWKDNPSLHKMSGYAAQLGETFLDTLNRVPPTQNVHEEGEGWEFDYQARLIFMSLVYHGVAHRTDITTFLNNRGIELPELDVWGYQSEFPDRFEATIKKFSG